MGDSQPFERPRLAEVARLAASQGGPISHEQLLQLDVSEGAIKYWLASKRLHRAFSGVYLLGHRAVTARGRLIAPLLAYGPDSAVSCLTAGHRWEWLKTAPKEVDITVPNRGRKPQRGVKLHVVRSLDERDVTELDGVRITTPERTLLDLAERLPLHRFRLVIDEADRKNHFHPGKLQELLRRSPGRKGQKPLRALLSDLHAEPLLRSEIERLFRDLCAEFDLATPITNTKVNGYEVDAYWPEHNLIVEVDSREHHLNGRAFEDDRRRDADQLAAGYRVMRITYRQLKWDRRGVAERLRNALLSG
jgi:hypothetical protein